MTLRCDVCDDVVESVPTWDGRRLCSFCFDEEYDREPADVEPGDLL